MALTKVSGGILDPGIDVAGIVTATGFDGPFVGGSSKNITAGTVTATELDINGNVDISGNLTVHGDQTTLNTTLREVELLRVDAAANVAAGIITQTGNGHGLVLADDTTFKMAMNVGSGIATFRALNAGYSAHNGASGIFQQVDLNTAAVTFGNTISVNGATITTGNSSHRIRSAANDFAIESITSAYKGFRFLGNVPENTLVVDDGNGGSVGIRTSVPGALLHLKGTGGSTSGIRFDNSHDTVFQHFTNDANDSNFLITYNGTGGAELTIHADGNLGLNESNGDDVLIGTQSVINNSKLTIVKAAAGLTTAIALGNGNASGDGSKIISTKSLVLSADYDANNADSKSYLGFETDGTERLRITSAGEIKIPSGTNSTSRLTFGGGINIYHDGNMKFENATGYLKLQSNNNLYIDGAELFFRNAGGTNRWKIDSSGHLLPGAVGSYNIGSTGAEIGNVYVADSKTIYVGSDQDFRIGHDPTHTVSYIQNTGSLNIQTDDLRLYNYSTADLYLRAQTNAAVQLFYDYSTYTTPKLQTSATGITVDGEVSATQDYPTIKPTLNFNFAATKKLDPRITYLRVGPASFVNESGKLVIVGHNTPRFNHNPTTRECEGLLIEGQRSNRIIYSADYTQSTLYTFSSYEGVFSENFGTAPDGSLTDAFLGEGNTGRHTLYIKVQAVGGGLSDNTKYAMSIFVKRVSNHSNDRYCKLETASYSTWTHSGSSAVFDLSNGTEVTSPGSNITSGIETYPNGWFRIHFETTTGTVATNTGFYLNICDSAGSTGSATLTSSQGLLVYGTQMEAGSFPTSYIHTNGSVEIRGHDKVTIDGEDFTDFYNQLESTVVCEFDSSNWITYNNNEYERIWSINNGSESDVFEIFKQNSLNNSIRYRVRDGAANVLGAANISYGTNTKPKMAFAVKLNDAAVAVDGTIAGTFDSTIPMPTPDRLVLGNDDQSDNNSLHGHIRKFMYYPVKLPDSQVVTLTS